MKTSIGLGTSFVLTAICALSLSLTSCGTKEQIQRQISKAEKNTKDTPEKETADQSQAEKGGQPESESESESQNAEQAKPQKDDQTPAVKNDDANPNDASAIVLKADLINKSQIDTLKKDLKLLDIPYGSIPTQKLDIYTPKSSIQGPYGVAIMVHGGGWRRGSKSGAKVIGNKPDYFGDKGYIFVSVDYRLSSESQYPSAAFDVAQAVAFIHANKESLNIDTDKNIMMGHSAGAHLANLVSVKPEFLDTFGVSSVTIKLVISLDTYFYDVERVYQDDGQNSGRIDMITAFFGTDTTLMRQGSPLNYIGAGDPPMIIFNRSSKAVKDNQDANSMVDKLMAEGILSERHVFPLEHNDFLDLGIPDHPTTVETDKFMNALKL